MSLPSSPAVDGHPRRPKALGQLVGRDQPGLIDNRIEILPRRLRQPAALWLRQTFAPEHPDPGSSAWTKRPTISVINASTLPGAMLLGVEIARPAAARSSMRPASRRDVTRTPRLRPACVSRSCPPRHRQKVCNIRNTSLLPCLKRDGCFREAKLRIDVQLGLARDLDPSLALFLR